MPSCSGESQEERLKLVYFFDKYFSALAPDIKIKNI